MMAGIVISLGFLFIFIVQFALRDSLYFMMEAARSKEVDAWNTLFTDYYIDNGKSWNGIQSYIDDEVTLAPDSSLVLRDRNLNLLVTAGEDYYRTVIENGLLNRIRIGQNYVASLYIYDEEIAGMSKWRISTYYSTLFFMVFGVLVLVALSLLVAYWLSKRLTAPLKQLLPAIDRLKQGELGVKVPVVTADEYGNVANAFNDLSLEMLRTERVRRNLVADVAHELRTPLTIMSGKLELIQQNKQDVKPAALLPIQDELLRLNRLVEDLHQLSLAEAGKLPLHKQQVEVEEWIVRIVEKVRDEAYLSGIQLIIEESGHPVSVFIDENRMTQVLMNLINNALRHTPNGGSIHIGLVHTDEAGHSPSVVTISVRDTGTGIDPEHLPHLFDRFYRADEGRSRDSGGMGLGLAISKQLVEAHGGAIQVESTLGTGTVFTITLPAN